MPGFFPGWGFGRSSSPGASPCARLGLEELVSGLAAVPGIDCVTLTTNGTGLASRAQALRQAGLAAVNISLDTLDPAVYERITRRPWLDRALEGLEAARRRGCR